MEFFHRKARNVAGNVAVKVAVKGPQTAVVFGKVGREGWLGPGYSALKRTCRYFTNPSPPPIKNLKLVKFLKVAIYLEVYRA
jgi:hypothetical protein